MGKVDFDRYTEAIARQKHPPLYPKRGRMTGVREYRLAEDVIPIVNQLPDEEAAKLVQHLVVRFFFGDFGRFIKSDHAAGREKLVRDWAMLT